MSLIRARHGWTIVELLVVIVVAALLLAAAAVALAGGQRSARAAAEIRTARADLRAAAAVLGHELRAISLADTVRLASDTAVELFTPLVTAVTCARTTTSRLLIAPLPPRESRNVAVVTPDTGDLVWVWQEDSILPPGRWLRSQLSSYSDQSPDGCDPALIRAGTSPGAITLPLGIGTIESGAPVQIVRRGRHSIYRASDGAWYLGYRRCDALGPSRCQIVQPVAGPYRVTSAGMPGIQFRYLTADGSSAPAPSEIARVELVIRSDVANMRARTPGRGALDDSTVLSVAVRNPF